MTGARPAAITLRTRRSDSATVLEFWVSRAKVPDLSVRLADDGTLAAAREELNQQLSALKNAMPAMTVGDDDAAEVFRSLRRLGVVQLMTIFHAKVVPSIQDFWRSVLPFGRNPRVPVLIECVGEREAMLPIEYLPLFDVGPPPRISDRATLIQACRALVGFSCIVKRSFTDLPVPQDVELALNPDGRLPVRFLYHQDLPGAKLEFKWFTESAAGHAMLEGPYPGDSPTGPALSEQIWNPGMAMAGGRLPHADQIQHFACHCYATSKAPMENEIELYGGGRNVRLNLRDLGADLMEHRLARSERPARMPLVMMNACGASRMAATSALSFPWLFLNNENRGFIGSDIEIPDDIAAEFSAAFYERLLIRRVPLGLAFLGARHHLLHAFGNPLGIGYSAYADPDLHVCVPLEGL